MEGIDANVVAPEHGDQTSEQDLTEQFFRVFAESEMIDIIFDEVGEED